MIIKEISKRIVFYTAGPAWVLAALNVMQEADSHDFMGGFLISSISLLAFCVTYIWVRKERATQLQWVPLAVSVISCTFGLSAYFFYVLSGSSNPDTAGHMHIFLFPILHTIIAVILNIIGLLFNAIIKSYSKETNL